MTSTSRAPDTVHIGGIGVRALVVDHVTHPSDVDSPGSDISGNQRGDGSCPELLQGTLPGSLVEITMNGCGGEAAVLQFVSQTLGSPLGAAEHHHLAHIARLGDAGDHLGLVQVVGLIHELGDVRHCRLGVCPLGADVDRTVQGGPGEGEDGGRHCC